MRRVHRGQWADIIEKSRPPIVSDNIFRLEWTWLGTNIPEATPCLCAYWNANSFDHHFFNDIAEELTSGFLAGSGYPDPSLCLMRAMRSMV